VTRSELVEQVATRSGLSKQQAADALDAVVKTVEETLAAGGEVTLAGFGKFHVAQRGARQGVNPRTRAPIEIGAFRVPRFSAGSGLKKAVRGS
jgi:DNA-binding protein HU-beta